MSQLESVVKKQTDLFLSQNNSLTSSDGGGDIQEVNKGGIDVRYEQGD